MRKNKNGIRLPISFSNFIKTHLKTNDFELSNESIFVSDLNLKTLIERSENDFQGRRLKQIILEKADFYTRDWLQDVDLGSYDSTQDLIFKP